MENDHVRIAPVPGFDGYFAVSNGTILSAWERGRWRRPSGTLRRLATPLDNHGYPQVNLTNMMSGQKRHFRLHRVILLAFVGPLPEGQETRHLNGDRTDCRLENLAYGTPTENMADMIRHRRTNRGERNPLTRLSWSDVRIIRHRVAAGEQQKALAAEYGVHPVTIHDIVVRKTWVPWNEEAINA